MLEGSNRAAGPRQHALQQITDPTNAKKPTDNENIRLKNIRPVSEYFGELTFNMSHMRDRLHRDAYQNIIRSLEKGEKISEKTADAVAQVVKDWAVTQGVTHFCHWFQPMTGSTAEKHDAFISIQTSHHSELTVMERFSGSQLIQGEPDASSFPSGGMRSTFEARGYTAWDPTSPIFILEGETSKTLCIPSVFFGYHGEALDLKTPLLRSTDVLSEACTEFLKLIGDVDAKAVDATLGVEQEYFLIDRRFAAQRPDIIMTGRTLVGAAPPRGQQLEDHYFGSIPTRVHTFMEDFEKELYRLGIPVKTRHNEVAPSQFEIAPIFENAVIAADHNTLTMEVIKRVANRNGFYCLLHEKPFKGLNGSGKHCNWSISNDKGENLLEPGKTPHQNLRFLAIISVVLKAVFDHADVLRASIASPGNDHRLGANEAPPAIISVFCGSLLSKIFENIEQGKASDASEKQIIDLGVNQIPAINRDYTDRNRTSPFAFTGNKFEFRAVGSSSNVAVPVSMLNAAIASTLRKASKRLEELLKGSKRDEAVMELVKEYLIESRNVRFDGNGYSQEWRKEAEKRKLPIFDSSAEAVMVFKNPKSIQFLIEQKVLNAGEVESRFNVQVERFIKTLMIEMSMLTELAKTYVIPAVEAQLGNAYKIADGASDSLKKSYKSRTEELEKVLSELLNGEVELTKMIDKIDAVHDEVKKMEMIQSDAIPRREALRAATDQAERVVSDELWPLPKYREMLFTHTIS
ncbi:MAG: glutamine synthetase III [Bdellovibrionota bacterium]